MPLTADVKEFISNAAARFGISTRYLTATAIMESGGNSNAVTGSAQGLFQFMPGTASEYGLVDPFDGQSSAYAAANLASSNFQSLFRGLGREPNDAELYLAHQQGAGGALALLTRGSERASSLVGAKAVTGNGGNLDMTGSDFSQFIFGKFAKAGGDTGQAGGVTYGAGTGAGLGEHDPSANYSSISSGIGHYFVRAVVVILGFIFVAVGLAMFSRQGQAEPINVNVKIEGGNNPPEPPKVSADPTPEITPLVEPPSGNTPDVIDVPVEQITGPRREFDTRTALDSARASKNIAQIIDAHMVDLVSGIDRVYKTKTKVDKSVTSAEHIQKQKDSAHNIVGSLIETNPETGETKQVRPVASGGSIDILPAAPVQDVMAEIGMKATHVTKKKPTAKLGPLAPEELAALDKPQPKAAALRADFVEPKIGDKVITDFIPGDPVGNKVTATQSVVLDIFHDPKHPEAGKAAKLRNIATGEEGIFAFTDSMNVIKDTPKHGALRRGLANIRKAMKDVK